MSGATLPLTLNRLNPLSDPRWQDLVDRHAEASAFHESGWIRALSATYGYDMYALTSASPGQPLNDGVVVCRVSSWLTGARLVSLPFSDHCAPLVSSGEDLRQFEEQLQADCDKQHCRYFELRALTQFDTTPRELSPSGSYWLHELDLTLSLDELFSRLHPSCFQRKIRKAERLRLGYAVGRSQNLIDEFYELLLITRRRHRLLPQPKSWFVNLARHMGSQLEVRVARRDGFAIAAILTLRHGSTVVYKYGCSDATQHHVGPMPFLFWRLIEESKQAEIRKLDLGRTDTDHLGLLAFKERMGSTRKTLTYYRYQNRCARERKAGMGAAVLTRITRSLSRLPNSALPAMGSVFYQHMG